MLHAIFGTQSHELGCDECLHELSRFAELSLAGVPVSGAMLLVQQHLERCNDCREEFEALLDMLRKVP